jgi:hypothetical protein
MIGVVLARRMLGFESYRNLAVRSILRRYAAGNTTGLAQAIKLRPFRASSIRLLHISQVEITGRKLRGNFIEGAK